MSSDSLQPDPTIFLDRSLEVRRLVDALSAQGLEVRTVTGEYGERGRHVPDDEWASHVASRNWLALSSDKKLLSGIGKEVLTEARLGVFYLWRNDVPGDVKVSAVLSNLAPMISLWRSEDRPFVYRFNASHITRVWP